MDNEEEKLKKVLALFDEEDIKYIDFDKVKSNREEKNSVKVKTIGDKNDRTRK